MSDPRVTRGMEAQLRERARRIAAGDEPLGWKVGFGAPAVMEQLGTSAALVGYLLAGARLESGAEVSLTGWRAPLLEAEIAVHLGADLPAGADRATVRAAVAGLSAAIELADLHPPAGDVEAMLAGDLYQRHVMLGQLQPGYDVEGVTARVRRNGELEGSTDDPTAATGDLLDVVAHVAATLAEAGERLRAGAVIITGAVIPPLGVRPGDRLEVVLEPLGTLLVRFSE